MGSRAQWRLFRGHVPDRPSCRPIRCPGFSVSRRFVFVHGGWESFSGSVHTGFGASRGRRIQRREAPNSNCKLGHHPCPENDSNIFNILSAFPKSSRKKKTVNRPQVGSHCRFPEANTRCEGKRNNACSSEPSITFRMYCARFGNFQPQHAFPPPGSTTRLLPQAEDSSNPIPRRPSRDCSQRYKSCPLAGLLHSRVPR